MSTKTPPPGLSAKELEWYQGMVAKFENFADGFLKWDDGRGPKPQRISAKLMAWYKTFAPGLDSTTWDGHAAMEAYFEELEEKEKSCESQFAASAAGKSLQGSTSMTEQSETSAGPLGSANPKTKGKHMASKIALPKVASLNADLSAAARKDAEEVKALKLKAEEAATQKDADEKAEALKVKAAAQRDADEKAKALKRETEQATAQKIEAEETAARKHAEEKDEAQKAEAEQPAAQKAEAEEAAGPKAAEGKDAGQKAVEQTVSKKKKKKSKKGVIPVESGPKPSPLELLRAKASEQNAQIVPPKPATAESSKAGAKGTKSGKTVPEDSLESSAESARIQAVKELMVDTPGPKPTSEQPPVPLPGNSYASQAQKSAPPATQPEPQTVVEGKPAGLEGPCNHMNEPDCDCPVPWSRWDLKREEIYSETIESWRYTTEPSRDLHICKKLLFGKCTDNDCCGRHWFFESYEKIWVKKEFLQAMQKLNGWTYPPDQDSFYNGRPRAMRGGKWCITGRQIVDDIPADQMHFFELTEERKAKLKEKERKLNGRTQSERKHGERHQAHPAKPGAVNQRFNRPDLQCYNCGEYGHIQPKCPLGILCHRCQQRGHTSKDCPTRKGRHGGSKIHNGCHNCGMAGHVRANCPKPPQENQRVRQAGNQPNLRFTGFTQDTFDEEGNVNLHPTGIMGGGGGSNGW
jgi:chemotaxis protein histidine kinase CheA